MVSKDKRESMKIVPPGKKKCVWMEAGVVSYKLCDNNYDCSTCVYDHAMQVKVARQKESAVVATSVETPADKFTATWVDKMMQLPASQRKCRYMITGEVARKICPNAYECGSCSFPCMPGAMWVVLIWQKGFTTMRDIHGPNPNMVAVSGWVWTILPKDFWDSSAG